MTTSDDHGRVSQCPFCRKYVEQGEYHNCPLMGTNEQGGLSREIRKWLERILKALGVTHAP